MRISLKNCSKAVDIERMKLSGDVYGQAAAWNVVFQYLHQNGMRTHVGNGIESVISFLEEKGRNKKPSPTKVRAKIQEKQK